MSMKVSPSALILNQKASEKRRLLIKGLSSPAAFILILEAPYVSKGDIRDISNLCLWRYRMKKGIDIYNYDRKFEATVRNMRASKIAEQNN